MEWKKGKPSAHAGRTIRSRFAQTRGKRSEGLLVRSIITNPSRDSNEGVADSVSYSLGKQNRWLLPEAIKTNSVEFEGEVVLIERYTSEDNKNRRQGTRSVFNSKKNNSTNDRNKKTKRKRTRCKDFPRDGEENALKTQYEVTYPNPSGWMSKSTKRPAVHQGKRKKNSCKIWMLEDDFDCVSDTECCYSEDENCSGEQTSGRTSSLQLDFDVLVDMSTKSTESNALDSAVGGTLHPENELTLTSKCIYVESDDEMHEAHLEILSQISAGCSLFDVRVQMKNAELTKGPVQKRRQRNRGTRRQQEHNNSPVSEESVAPVDTIPPDVKPSYMYSDVAESVMTMLRKQDIVPVALEQQWGQMYKEGACYPRAFVLNVTQLLSIPNSQEVFIVFRVFEDQYCQLDCTEVKALVTMVICNDDAWASRVPREFASHIEAKSTDQKSWSLEDIVNVVSLCLCSDATSCSKNEMQYTKPRPPRMSLDVFSDLFGWKSKTYSARGAKQEIKESAVMTKDFSTTAALVGSSGQQQHLECGICFQETQATSIGFDVTSSFMSLRGCGHMFCDDCWKAHLKTQIQLGHTDLRCPGHECTVAVDDVTLMSLVPSWYGRLLTKRLDTFLEIDPKWKWCPADRCNLVVKATMPQSPSLVFDEHVGGPQPVPVACVCGSMWCFKCREDAHWPATCEEAREFREKNASYARLTTAKEKTLVTSVHVKHCPFCYYPVEKGMGCDHMICIMCFKEFCWACLEKWTDYGHRCKKLVNLRKVKLPTKLVHVCYKHVAVTSRVARTSFLICKVHRKLDRIRKELNLYANCFPLKPGSSRAEQRLNQLCKNNTICELKEVFNFKFQALLVLEGAAMRLSFAKDTPCSKKLAMEFGRLFFIVERMDEILKDLNSCLKDKNCLFKLKHFVKCGKSCILLIGNNAATNEENVQEC